MESKRDRGKDRDKEGMKRDEMKSEMKTLRGGSGRDKEREAQGGCDLPSEFWHTCIIQQSC